MADAATGPQQTFDQAASAFDHHIRGDCIGVAVSGGSDSMALLAMLHRWSKDRSLKIRAATVDHGLRPEARAEAEMVASFCAARGISHDILTIGPLPKDGNLPANAREARYNALATRFQTARCVTDAPYADRAGDVGCVRDAPLVMLGHTMDDQAETVLLRLARGSGAEGLSAMTERREFAGITWVRPLLGLRRDALRDWLRAEGIDWIDDPTNADERYDRVKARKALALLAPLGITSEGLSDTAATLSRQRVVLDTAAEELRKKAVRPWKIGSIKIDRAALRTGGDDTQLRVLAEALQSVNRSAYRPRFRALEPLWRWAMAASDARPRTLAGCMVLPRAEDDSLLIFRELKAQPPAVQMPQRWDGWWLKNSNETDWIGPLGEAGDAYVTREIAHQGSEWLNLPRRLRITAPTIYADATAAPDAILALPHAGWAPEIFFAGVIMLRDAWPATDWPVLRR